MKAKKEDIFSREYLGFNFPWHLADENSKEKPFVQIRNHYKKVGSKWVLTDSVYYPITAKEYAYGCSKDTTRFFNNLGYARQELGHSDLGYICWRWYSISPDKTEKSESLYFTQKEWANRGKWEIMQYNSKPRH